MYAPNSDCSYEDVRFHLNTCTGDSRVPVCVSSSPNITEVIIGDLVASTRYIVEVIASDEDLCSLDTPDEDDDLSGTNLGVVFIDSSFSLPAYAQSTTQES